MKRSISALLLVAMLATLAISYCDAGANVLASAYASKYTSAQAVLDNYITILEKQLREKASPILNGDAFRVIVHEKNLGSLCSIYIEILLILC